MLKLKFYVKQLSREDVTLTAYIPETSKEMPWMDKRPAMLVIPGGAYMFCSDREAEPIALAYAAKGYNAYVLRYSIGKGKAKFPAPLEDAEEAMDFIIANAEEDYTDVSKIAAIGFSAGGHLCAALATMGRVKPAATVLVYPCILESMSRILAEPIPSLDGKVDSSTPPAFITSAAADDCVPIENSLAYATALAKAGVPFEMHIYERGYHGYSLADRVVYDKETALYVEHIKPWFDLSVRWLDERFGMVKLKK